MKKLLLLVGFLLLIGNPIIAAQKTVTVGTASSKADIDVNFGNIHDNFTEIYGWSWYTQAQIDTFLSGKQDTLVSGANIKTINGISVLGSGDMVVDLAAHLAAVDPHTGYMLESNIGTGANNYIQLNADGDLPFAIGVDATGFNGNLATTDDTLQEVAQKVDDLIVSGGSFAFDTFPAYEDSAHTSGVAVNATQIAVYSVAASKWLTASLTDSLDPTPDTTPTAFSFTDQTDASLSTLITSDPITIAGINASSPITVIGGTYDINASGTFVSTEGTVFNGDTVRAQHTSSASNSTATDTTVTIGGVSDVFTSTTVAASASAYYIGFPADTEVIVADSSTPTETVTISPGGTFHRMRKVVIPAGSTMTNGYVYFGNSTTLTSPVFAVRQYVSDTEAGSILCSGPIPSVSGWNESSTLTGTVYFASETTVFIGVSATAVTSTDIGRNTNMSNYFSSNATPLDVNPLGAVTSIASKSMGTYVRYTK